MISAPPLETERLLLVPIAPEDAPDLFPVWSDPAVTEFFMLDPFSSTEQAREMAVMLAGLPESGEGQRWVIRERSANRVLGTCGFHNVKRGHSRAEIGYEIAKEAWGKGLMSEALRALVSHCFDVCAFNRLEAFVTLGNERSCRILERNGFQREGTLHDYEFARGRFWDHIVFSMLRRHWHEDPADGRGLSSGPHNPPTCAP